MDPLQPLPYIEPPPEWRRCRLTDRLLSARGRLAVGMATLAVALAGCGNLQQAAGPQDGALAQAAAATGTERLQPSFPTVDLVVPAGDVWKRIRRGYAIPNLDSAEVDTWTEFYAARPDMVHRLMQRSTKYLYYVVDEINRRGLPTELALLPFVESGWDPTALSRSQASGLWQFIPSTGRHFKLQQNEWLDERRDLVASTKAALDYLEYLFNFQGDWYLALASYNWGEGSVQRAMQKNQEQGLRTDYLALTMPAETRNYVPKLQAIKNIVAQPQRYGITLPPLENQPYFVTVPKFQDIDVALAARLADVPLEEFTALNPAFKRGVIPARDQRQILLPVGQVDVFLANLDAYDGPLVSPSKVVASAARPSGAALVHKVRSGDTLYKIAARYRTTVKTLQSMNRMKSSHLRIGQVLRVPATGRG